MHKLNWQPIRISLLAATLGCVLLAIAKVATAPKSENGSVQASDTLPPTVPIADWQFLDSTAIESTPDSRFGRRYRYRNGDRQLDVDLQYMISDGNVSRYLFVYTPVKTANANLVTKYQPEIGFYGAVSYKGRAYLTACINPRGESTVTEQQFTQNRYTHDLRADRIVPWVLGRESLIDRRCLWTLMSTLLKTNSKSEPVSSEGVYKDLETAWFSWHRWWQLNFPPS